MESQDIAIVGISVFCPAGDDVDEFWSGIARGGDFITEVPEDAIEPCYFSGEPNGIDRFYCKRGGFSNVFKVDPIRYGIMPITAGGTDPDHLISLAATDQALIDAGVFEKKLPLQNCSIIIGKGNFSGITQLRSVEIIRMAQQLSSLLKSALPDLTDEDLEKVRKAYQSKQGRYQPDMAIGTMPNLVASLVANRFDMHGPAYTVDAACSSGIVAINHSISLLRSGQCDLAVAGGMHSAHNAMFWGAFDLLGAMSRKQVIAPFSEDADGLLIGQGGGFVVLKTLKKALEDDDRIYAVIKETAICSDGASSHVTVTSVSGQMRALEQAWQKAGMDPERIGYVEAHGTGTIAGDRTEITTLKNFFGDNTHPRAYVGSVKSNIGHTMPAAGMIGIIKTALALYWRKIPPTLHCERPLAAMFESRFMPPQELIDWDGEQIPLIAGVNAFGFGGINAHAIMYAYEPPARRRKPKPYWGEALMVSAVDGQALVLKLEKGYFTDTGGNYRIVVFDPSEERIRQAIGIVKNDAPSRGESDIWFTNKPLLSDGGKIAFLFPDVASEWDNDMDSLSDSLKLPYIDELISEGARQGGETSESSAALRAYCAKQLIKMGLDKLGVEADMYAGTGIGEWVAAMFAGMAGNGWSQRLLDEMVLLCDRKNFKPRRFVAVGGVSRQEAQAWCDKAPNLHLAGDYCPSQVLLCGDEASVAALMDELEKKGFMYKDMPAGPGWHTPFALEEMALDASSYENARVQEGLVPVWSSSTLDLVPTDGEEYINLLSSQMARPIYFREMIEKLYDERQARVFIQIGLGSLTGFVEDILKDRDFGAISTSVDNRACADQMRRAMALIFIEGRQADAAFLGVKMFYRVAHNPLTLSRGAPPYLTELPELSDAVRRKYISAESGAAFFAESPRGHSDPITAAVNENIRGAIEVQRELSSLFERRLNVSGLRSPDSGAFSARQAKAALAPSRIGVSFEDTLHLKLDDHPYLQDHSIVRQPKGWPFHGDLNPVVPFTMTIELVAEIAKNSAPGEKLVRIANVTAYKWIGLEKPCDVSVKGKWIKQDVIEITLGEYAKAECTLSESWPELPDEYVKEWDIGPEISEPIPARVLYDNFSFHGPQYHSLIEQTRICARGMKCIAEKQVGKGSLLDIMGQQLGLYLHLTQTENTISFPVRMRELVFYEDIFDQEGTFDHTMLITQLSDSSVAGNMVLKRGGKVWSVAHDFVCQRFVNVISVWNVIVNPHKNCLAEEIAPGVAFLESEASGNLLFILAKRYMSGPDREFYDKLGSPKSQRENIISRITLKDAVRSYVADGGDMMHPIEFYCTHDDNGKPYVIGYGRAASKVDCLHVSIAHKGNASAAIAAREPVGIDLERIEEKSESFIKMAYTDSEIELLKGMEGPEAVIRFWVAKEASAKKTGFGLRGDPKSYEVKAVEGDTLLVGDTRVRTVKIEPDYIMGWTV
jgi:acyl transferase domain-containing protein/phosphopantetheinyl transferase (holo-ACP synthase)